MADTSKKQFKPLNKTQKKVTPVKKKVPSMPKDAVPKDAIPKDTAQNGTATKSMTPKGTAPKETTPRDTIPKDKTPKETTPKEATPRETTPKATVPKSPQKAQQASSPVNKWGHRITGKLTLKPTFQSPTPKAKTAMPPKKAPPPEPEPELEQLEPEAEPEAEYEEEDVNEGEEGEEDWEEAHAHEGEDEEDKNEGQYTEEEEGGENDEVEGEGEGEGEDEGEDEDEGEVEGGDEDEPPLDDVTSTANNSIEKAQGMATSAHELPHEKLGQGKEAANKATKSIQTAPNGPQHSAAGGVTKASKGAKGAASGARERVGGLTSGLGRKLPTDRVPGISDATGGIPGSSVPDQDAAAGTLESAPVIAAGETFPGETPEHISSAIGQAPSSIGTLSITTIGAEVPIPDQVTDAAKQVPSTVDSDITGIAGALPTDKLDDLTTLVGKSVDSSGNITNDQGEILGKAASATGDANNLAGKTVSGSGDIVDEAGNLLGNVKVVASNAVTSDGPLGEAPGLVGKTVDEKASVVDEAGNVLGKASGDVNQLAGKSIDPHGNVVDSTGSILGKVSEIATDASRTSQDTATTAAPSSAFLDTNGNYAGQVSKNFTFNIPSEKAREAGVHQDVNKKTELLGAVGKEVGDPVSDKDIYLNVQSTREGISLTVRIPTGYIQQ